MNQRSNVLTANYIVRSPLSFPAKTCLHRAHFHCTRSSGSNIRHGPLLYRLRCPATGGADCSLPRNTCITTCTRVHFFLSLFFFIISTPIFRGHILRHVPGKSYALLETELWDITPGISQFIRTYHQRVISFILLQKIVRFIHFSESNSFARYFYLWSFYRINLKVSLFPSLSLSHSVAKLSPLLFDGEVMHFFSTAIM